MFFLWLRFAKSVLGFEPLYPIALLGANVRFGYSGAVISECKEVALFREANWFDWAYNIDVKELIWLFCILLRFPVIFFYCFGLLTAIINVAIEVVIKKNLKAAWKSLERRKVDIAQLFVPIKKKISKCRAWRYL